jgi:cellulose synthase/poly-beta-1,6-N-acetylglucosamine synthase-like glycosyltransferase
MYKLLSCHFTISQQIALSFISPIKIKPTSLNNITGIVIVPVYNVASFLSACIDSLLGQTLSDIQIILINDGSKDNSGSICDEYANKDSRVVVFHKKKKWDLS